MSQEQVMGIVRHVLTFVGGLAVAKGMIDSGTLAEGIGAVVTLVGLAWSLVAKRK